MYIILIFLITILLAFAAGFLTQEMAKYLGLQKPLSKALSVLIGCLIGLMSRNYFLPSLIKKTADEAKVLVVGTSADFPPFSFVENDQIVGFDIDLIHEIGKRLQQQITLKNMPFGTLLPTLQLGQIQVIAAGLSATPERAQHVLFTSPYLDHNPFVIVSLATNPAKTITDLHSGKRLHGWCP